MHGSREKQRETIRLQFGPSIIIDFQGAKIASDTGSLLLREIDELFGVLALMDSELDDIRTWVHSKHTLL